MLFRARTNKRRRRIRGGEPTPPIIEAGLWSNPATWGGSVPTNGQNVTIAAGTTVLLDTATAELDCLDIAGTLRALPNVNVTITANCIEIASTGLLEIGTPLVPYTAQAVIELTGAFVALTPNASKISGASAGENDAVSRGLLVMGQLLLVGNPPTLCQTLLNASCAASATSFSLTGAPGWKSGDQIIVGPTDYYGYASGVSSALILSGDSSGTAISTTTGIPAARYGELQYPTDSGMSLTSGTFTPPATPHPTVLDQRAPIINTTRNIKIQGKNDAHWTNNGHGVHVMLMGTSAYCYIDGVEFKRCGQRGALGRYPMHWHMLSYNEATGAYLADNSSVMKNCAVWDSENRAITIHGTCGVTVDNNVCYDISGHAVFFEDGSERRNFVTRNTVLKVRAPTAAFRLKLHDSPQFIRGPSGFWITNLNNTIEDNRAADCEALGFWLSLANQCFGNSILVSVRPQTMPPISYKRNIGHSNKIHGQLTDFVVVNDTGGTSEASQYGPTSTGILGGPAVIPNLHKCIMWKNNEGGYRNRVLEPLYDEWTQADNGEMDFQGQTSAGNVTRSLCIGTSLNSSTYPATGPRAAFATYNGSITFHHNTLINFPFSNALGQFGSGGGMFRHDDHYLFGIEKETIGIETEGNHLIDTNGGFRTRGPNLRNDPAHHSQYAFAGALYDANGISTSAGFYWIYDEPFFTSGLTTVVDVTPAGQNEVATPTPFYAVAPFWSDFDKVPFKFTSPMTVLKVDNSLNTLGTWQILDGANSAFLGWMRHVAVHQGGRYIFTFPGEANPTTILVLTVMNCLTGSDDFIMAFPWSGSVIPRCALRAIKRGAHNLAYPTAQNFVSGIALQFTSAASRAVVEAGPGNLFWQDTVNNLVWIKIVGGQLTDPGWSTKKELLYKFFDIIIVA